MATATRERVAAPISHKEGCPVALHPEDEALAARVELTRTTRPARMEQRDGIQYPVPPEPLIVAHCCECGNVTYTKE